MVPALCAAQQGSLPGPAYPRSALPAAPAAPAPQALRDVLAGIPYNDNDVYLHTDESLMPVRLNKRL